MLKKPYGGKKHDPGHYQLPTVILGRAVMDEIAMSGLALAAGLAAFGLVRFRRPRRLAAAVGALITGLGVAAVYWVTEPEGLGGIGHAIIRGSVLVFVVLPAAIATAAMEVQHRRRSRDLGTYGRLSD